MQATDIRIAAEHATFGLSEAKRALVPAGGSRVRLIRQIPYCKAMEILLTGDRISAAEACRIGLVNYVVPAAEVMPTVERFAHAIARTAPCALEVIQSKDAKEGPRAFMEKRPPRYAGRWRAERRSERHARASTQRGARDMACLRNPPIRSIPPIGSRRLNADRSTPKRANPAKAGDAKPRVYPPDL